MTRPEGREAVEAVWRIESARIVGTLTRYSGDFSLAEDVAQEALAEALVAWPTTGCRSTRRPGCSRSAGGARSTEALGPIAPSPVVELNRALAISVAQGPAAALPLVNALVEADTCRGRTCFQACVASC